MTGVEHVELETAFGHLRGARMEGVTAFRRVPYAEAPVGPLRFEMPSAPPRWQGVRDATAVGPVPPQNPSRLDLAIGTYDVQRSEDCLHLDTWTDQAAGARAPVLVFIHGGAFMTGGGSLPCYDGGVLAKQNGLVVVNITYRLGILGFFPHPALGRLNLGLHDQVAALRWIGEAISAFGGDPQRITVIGQSAGGLSIAALAASEAGPKLFNRAILMSAPVGIKLRTVEQAQPITDAILNALGVAAGDVDKLRTLPIDQMLEGLWGLQKRGPAIPGETTPPFMPVLDDSLVQRDPSESVQMGRASWCDMMIGVTREEHAAFSFSNSSLDEMSEDALEAVIRSLGDDDPGRTLSRLRSARVPATPRTLLGDFYTERDFTKQSLEIAGTQSRLGRKAFMYWFDWQSPVPELGACHCIDLPFLFGNFDVWQAGAMVRDADLREMQELSRLFRGAIAEFAATGGPNGQGLPVWPAYAMEQAILHFDRRIAASRHIS